MIAKLRCDLEEMERAAEIAAMFGLTATWAALHAKASAIRGQIRIASLTEVECLARR